MSLGEAFGGLALLCACLEEGGEHWRILNCGWVAGVGADVLASSLTVTLDGLTTDFLKISVENKGKLHQKQYDSMSSKNAINLCSTEGAKRQKDLNKGLNLWQVWLHFGSKLSALPQVSPVSHGQRCFCFFDQLVHTLHWNPSVAFTEILQNV